MNDNTLKSIPKNLVPENYLTLANDARVERDKQIKLLLEQVCKKRLNMALLMVTNGCFPHSLQRKLPASGWCEPMIEHCISELALLDSNNFPTRCGLGEREGRIVCGKTATRSTQSYPAQPA